MMYRTQQCPVAASPVPVSRQIISVVSTLSTRTRNAQSATSSARPKDLELNDVPKCKPCFSVISTLLFNYNFIIIYCRADVVRVVNYSYANASPSRALTSLGYIVGIITNFSRK